MPQKISFRDRPEVKADIFRLTIEGASLNRINNYLQEKYGKGVRKTDLATMRHDIKGTQKDLERAAKSVPIKYAKDKKDTREYMLVMRISTLGKGGEGAGEALATSGAQPVTKSLPRVQDIASAPPEKVKDQYFRIEIHMGSKYDLQQKLALTKQYFAVESYTLVPAGKSARVLSAIEQVAGGSGVAPWLDTLKSAAMTSETSSFQKLVGRL